jgi:hypothetical protein
LSEAVLLDLSGLMVTFPKLDGYTVVEPEETRVKTLVETRVKLGNELGNTKETILIEMCLSPKIRAVQLASILDICTTGHWEVME